MDEKNIRRLPVVDYKGQMVGIVTGKDLLKVVINIFKENFKDHDLKSEGFDLLGLIGAE
ncbi:MAG: CBS domain-containing protein [Candidatus Nitrosopolaris sp.]|jgi:CBS domain-containing protein